MIQYGMTPLILATKDKNEEIIYILLHAGADLNLQTDDVSVLNFMTCENEIERLQHHNRS